MLVPTSWRDGLAPLLVGVLLAVALSPLPIVRQVDLRLGDALARAVSPPSPAPAAIVVAIDESSLASLAPVAGAWPWGRDVWAYVLSYLHEAGAAAVIVDVLLHDSRAGDDQFTLALHRHPDTVLAAVVAPFTISADREPASIAGWEVPAGVPARRWEDVTTARDDFARASVIAVATVQPDADQLVRRVTPLHHVGNTHLPSLPLVSVAGPRPALRWEPGWRGSGTLRAGSYILPVDASGDVELWFPRNLARNGPVPFHRVARAALTGESDADLEALLAGQVVIIGATALLIDDPIDTPAGRLAGVDFLATATTLLRDGRTLRPRVWFAEFLIVVVGMLVAWRAASAVHNTMLWLLLALPLASAVALGAGGLLLRVSHQRTSLIPALLAIAGVVGTKGVHELMRLRREQRRLLTERLAAERAFQLKTQFLNHITHELRTPVSAILGFSRLLERQVGVTSAMRGYTGAISRNAVHMLQLVNNLLDDARLAAGRVQSERRPASIRQVVADVIGTVEGLPRNPGVEVRAELDHDVPDRLAFDELRVRQVVLNLVANAVKFTSQGSVVVRATWMEGSLQVTVEDTGPGIESDALERIFDEFEFGSPNAMRAGGSGLGLSVSRRLARLMDGDLAVWSQVGEGSRFVLTIPATTVEPKSQAGTNVSHMPRRQTPAVEPTEARTPTVLVCDDSEDIRQLFSVVVEDAGFRVVLADNGRDAVDIAMRERPDAVLMDVDLPVLSGPDAVEEMRRLGFVGPVIAVTGAGDRHGADGLRARGFSEVLHKPLPLARVISVLRDHLPDWPGTPAQLRPPSSPKADEGVPQRGDEP